MLIRADARDLPLRDGCVDCVVTSPPYFGLRDYGTATWKGGNSTCDHRSGRFARGGLSAKQASNSGSSGDEATQRCPKCGAQRMDRQIGLERTVDAYVAELVTVFREVRRVLTDDGVCWLNLGDTYCGYWGDAKALADGRRSSADTNGWTNGFNMNARPKYEMLRASGIKPKDLIGIPWRVAFALQADGWYLRSDIIWHKPNPMPESVTDRPTKSHEYLFLLTKQERYYYDAEAIMELGAGRLDYGDMNISARLDAGGPWKNGSKATLGRNKRSVWTISTEPYDGAHFATMPEALVEPCILAGSPLGGLVLDPFIGSGTVGAVAERLGRRWVGIDLAYQDLATERTAQCGLQWA